MKNIGLAKVLKEDNEYGGFLDGDFNSNASTQSWGEFFSTWLAFGPAVAIGKEVSSWHGERELKYYNHPYGSVLPKEGQMLPLPENYEISYITGSMSASDLVDGVKKDENGEYFGYDSLGQNLKFYLPNSSWFSTFYNGMPYKFKNEIGEIYTLLLSLTSNKTNTELQTGSDTSEDNMKKSLKNLSPDLGNGWFISAPPDLSGRQFEYYKKVGDNFIAYNIGTMNQSVKSSFQLFWEKWGVIIQIVASVVLAYFTGGLSVFIEGLFAAESALGVWLAASGSFTVSRATVMAMFLLETAVNLPAAFIDRSFNNKFGFWLGVAFCFFPVVSSYGRLGKFIKGKYSEETVKGMLDKISAYGISETTTQEQLFKFITEELNSEEKLMWSEMMKLLSKQEGAEALNESIKEAFKNAAKQGDLPSKFKSWWKASEGSQSLKTFLAAGIYFIDVTKWYAIIEKIKETNNDPRSLEQIFSDSQSGVNEVKENFKKSDTNTIIITKPSDKIIADFINSQEVDEGGQLIYNLSKKGDKTYFIDLVADKKMEEFEKGIRYNEKILNATYEQIQDIFTTLKEANSLSTEPKTDEEIFSWFDPEDSNVNVLQYLASYSDDMMSSEIKIAVNKYKCLSTNFKYVDGYPLKDSKWVLSFIVTKPITIKHDSDIKLTLPINSKIWLFDDGNFTYNNIDYKNFTCR